MAHEDFSREHPPKRASDRSFAVVMTVWWTLVAIAPIRHHQGIRTWSAALAVAFAFVGAVRPSMLAPLNDAWMRLALALNRLTSPIVMGAVFFGVVAPMGLLMRAARRSRGAWAPDAAAETYWESRGAPTPMTRQF